MSTSKSLSTGPILQQAIAPFIGELEETENIFRDSSFYAPMRDDEWKEIMTVVRRENIGTGHWYTCEKRHPFAVEECEGPMQQTICPECESPVGGLHHQAAQGVRRAADLETIWRDETGVEQLWPYL